jgi:hypothetical protein
MLTTPLAPVVMLTPPASPSSVGRREVRVLSVLIFSRVFLRQIFGL